MKHFYNIKWYSNFIYIYSNQCDWNEIWVQEFVKSKEANLFENNSLQQLLKYSRLWITELWTKTMKLS